MLIEDLYRECFALSGGQGFRDPAKAMDILSELNLKRERLMLVKESLFDLDPQDNLMDDAIVRYTVALGLCESGRIREFARHAILNLARDTAVSDPRLPEIVRAYLSIFPGDFRPLETLERNSGISSELQETLAGLRRQYACVAEPPIRVPQMSSPRAIAPFGQGGFAVVACDAKKVLILDREGCFAGEVEGPFNGMHGLFPSPEGTVWVCDFGGDRLYEIAPDGQKLQVVESSVALGERDGEARGVTGCFHGGSMYLQVCGPAFKTGRLAVLDRAGDAWTGRVIDAPTVVKPGGIHGVGGEIWYADRQRPTITAWNPETAEARTVFMDPSLLVLNDFTVSDDEIILSTDKGLSKYTAEGERIFSHSLETGGGATSVLMRMHTEQVRDGAGETRRVHLCDVGMNAVHVVRI